MARVDLDLSSYDAQGSDYEPIPPGEYTIRVLDSEVTHSKAGNPMAIFTYEVLGPTHAGRKLWDYFVLNNEVALKRFKGLAEAVGYPNPNFIRDTEDLHGLQCSVRVSIEEQEGYSPKNKITSYKRFAEVRPAQARDNAAPPPKPVQSAARKSVPPWEAAQ
jgi:hypothetical protein